VYERIILKFILDKIVCEDEERIPLILVGAVAGPCEREDKHEEFR
jgi:hypothetical protein